MQETAKRLVVDNYNAHRNPEINEKLTIKDVKVEWFSKTFGHWKAVVVTNRRDGLRYEVAYNDTSKETHIDIYNRIANTSTAKTKV